MEEKSLILRGFLYKDFYKMRRMWDTLNKWYNGILNKENIDIVYIDFQKAFDKVPIDFLLYKLYYMEYVVNYIIG